jgi:hypothetical protein
VGVVVAANPYQHQGQREYFCRGTRPGRSVDPERHTPFFFTRWERFKYTKYPGRV